MTIVRQIYCAGCRDNVDARLTDGREIYSNRRDLAKIPFWRCDNCSNYVGCHYKTKDRTRPLGIIPTKELRNERVHIHRILDPLWQNGLWDRNNLYREIARRLEIDEYHTAGIRSVEDARLVYWIVAEIEREARHENIENRHGVTI